jgi:hypothetical protein
LRLFDQFVIREPEVSACRVVSYLLQRSPELRDGLIGSINDKIRGLWLVNRNQFSCVPEQPIDGLNPEDVRGRVDVFIEIDSAVIAIEAKLNAPLQSDQPTKYLNAVTAIASKLGPVRGIDIAAVLVLLVPEGRRSEAERVITSQSAADRARTCVLTWEELFKTWSEARVTDTVAAFVLDELEQFVLTQTGRRQDFQRLLPLLRSPLSEATHEAHREFIGWLYPAFRGGNRPSLTTRLHFARNRTERTYIGYYFALGQLDGCWGWYGFVDARFADDRSGNEPALVVGTDFDVPWLDGALERVKFTHAGFNKDARWWRIRFDRGWDNLTRWQDVLSPLRRAVERCAGDRQALPPR